MFDIRERGVRIASIVVDSLALQLIIALAPAAIGAIMALALSHPRLAVASLGIGWSGSGLIGVLWFRNHRAKQAGRMLRLARALFVSDSVLPWWITNARRSSSDVEAREKLRSDITNLFTHMCHILAYRVSFHDKGATLLVIDRNGEQPCFELFARFSHDDPAVRDEVRTRLPITEGLAAQAIRRGKCTALRDCENNPPDSGIEWVSIHTPERFCGRACSRVGAWINGEEVDIGALCFDVKKPWLLQKEDQQLMDIFADKIAGLWVLNHHRRTGRDLRGANTASLRNASTPTPNH